MNIIGIILMGVCYGILIVPLALYISEKIAFRSILIIPMILVGVGITSIETKERVEDKPKYEQVTETFYRKIK